MEFAGLKTPKMARLLGVSENTVRNYLKGKSAPTRALLVAWSTICQVPFEWISGTEEGASDLPNRGFGWLTPLAA